RKYPGVLNQPRHWLRSSPQGDAIAFLMKDDDGVVQLYTVSPTTKAIRQVTLQQWDIQSAFTWSHSGEYLTFICDNSVMLCNAKTGELTRLTDKTAQAPSGDAVVFSPNDQY
ncbi:biopolymer transporter Tol, partial [Klebsiella oxytoca]